MANAISHVSDSYYFELPKAIWSYTPEQAKEAAPRWLISSLEEELGRQPSGEELAATMSGKVLIPQPFGTPADLYNPGTGFSLSRYMIVELVVAIVLAAVFIGLANHIQAGRRARGRFWNFWEAILLFIRDQVARPTIGSGDAQRYLPYIWTLFFFILFANLFGMIPFLGTVTGSTAVTTTLALMTFCVVVVSGIARLGFGGFFGNMMPKGLPLVMLPLIGGIFLIELASFVVKHGVLSIRLLGNMNAGHLVLFGLLDIPFVLEAQGTPEIAQTLVITASIIGATLFSLLELFVAFLQAYIFAFLTSLFIGAAIHHH